MTTRLQDLQNICNMRKVAVINDELLRLRTDIAALQESRLADSGTRKEKDLTFFWQGKTAEHYREHGVGTAIGNLAKDG